MTLRFVVYLKIKHKNDTIFGGSKVMKPLKEFKSLGISTKAILSTYILNLLYQCMLNFSSGNAYICFTHFYIKSNTDFPNSLPKLTTHIILFYAMFFLEITFLFIAYFIFFALDRSKLEEELYYKQGF